MDKEQREKYMMQISQVEAAYVPLTAADGQACANCRWLCVDEETHCHLVERYPENILPTGWCNRWEEKPDTEVKPAPVPVVIVEEAEAENDDMIKGEKALPEKPANPIARAIRGLFNKKLGAFTVFKGMDGQDYWVARYTNSFLDRQKEIIKDKALADYVDRVNNGFVPMPELWFWHVKGSRHGEATWLGHVGRFVVAVGTFDATPMAQRAKTYYRKHKSEITLSQGFLTPVWAEKKGDDGVTTYDVMNTFEITTLPPGAAVAANPYTSFEEVQEMAISQKQLTLLKEVLGEEAAARIITETETQSKALEDLGVRYKDFVDTNDEQPVAKSTDDGMAQAFVDLLQAQNEQLKLQKAMAGKQTAIDTQHQADTAKIDSLEQRIKALETELELKPRASEADATVTTDATSADALKQKQTDEPEAFNPFPSPKK